MPDPKAGEDARVVAARERAGRVEANARISQGRLWYEERRADYASSGD